MVATRPAARKNSVDNTLKAPQSAFVPSAEQIAAALTSRTYTFRELVAVSGATRKEIADWARRESITTERSPGSGRHRKYTWRNLIEVTISKSLSIHIRAQTRMIILGGICMLMDNRDPSWESLVQEKWARDELLVEIALLHGALGMHVAWKLPARSQDWQADMRKKASFLEIDLGTLAAETLFRAKQL